MLVRPSFPLPGRRWLVLLAAVACASCSKGDVLNPVQGKILDTKGQPLEGAVVTFHPKGAAKSIKLVLPVGRSGADGTFTLTTGDKEGAPAGEYTVTVICPEEKKLPKGKISTAPPESKDRFEGAYANPGSSRLQAQVKAGPNQLEPFQLK
jgi:hypothetical protein